MVRRSEKRRSAIIASAIKIELRRKWRDVELRVEGMNANELRCIGMIDLRVNGMRLE